MESLPKRSAWCGWERPDASRVAQDDVRVGQSEGKVKQFRGKFNVERARPRAVRRRPISAVPGSRSALLHTCAGSANHTGPEGTTLTALSQTRFGTESNS